MTRNDLPLDAPLLIGFGITGRAVAAALVKRGFNPTVVEDRPGPDAVDAADGLGVELLAAPSPERLDQAMSRASALVAPRR